MVRLFSEYLLDPKILTALATKALASAAKPDDGAAHRASQLAKLEAERKRATNLIVKGLMPEKEGVELLRNIERLKAEIQAQAPVPVMLPDVRFFVRWFARMFARFATLPFNDQQELLRKRVRKIVVKDRAILSLTLVGGAFDDDGTNGVKVSQHSTPLYSRQCRGRGSKRRAR